MFQSVLKGGATSSNRLLVGDPEGHVSIVTLWSKVSEMEKKVDKSKYCIMGQLFSAERGLDLLVRNLLANPQITNLIVTGVDFSKSGIVLEDFFREGFEKGVTKITKKPVWRVKSRYEGYIGLDIPEEALEELRQTVAVTRVADISRFDFSSLEKPSKTRARRIYEKKEEKVKKYTGDYSGYVVRGRTIAEAWLKVLDTVLKFGKESQTHYGEPQREVLNLLSIIEEEDPSNFYIPEWLPCNEERIKAYIPRITRDMPGGIHKNEYTYGSRMRSWFGTDQVERAVRKLAREPVSRAVVIGLWDPVKDLEIGGSPCLNHIWLRLSEGRLYMTCIFRSHDMFEGYPENAFGLRRLQEDIRKELQERLGKSVVLGELIILSQSAHLYRDTWEWAEKVTRLNLPAYTGHMSRLDPRGNFIISLEGQEIVLEHTGPGGEKIGEFRAATGEEMRDILSRENVVSLIPHALDLGMEIMKAETAKKLGIRYVQDQPLPLENRKSETSSGIPAATPDGRTIQRRVIKEGIIQTESQKKLYPKILHDARIDSIAV
jgi:thymidylate synthase